MRYIPKSAILKTIMVVTLILPTSIQAYSGVISVDTVEAVPNGHIGIPIRLSNNDEPISGLTIPLKFSSQLLTVDSVSFVGSMLPLDFDGHVVIDNFAHEIKISYIAKFVNPIPTMTTSNGLIGTVFLSVSAAAAPGTTLPIDSINIDTIITDGGPAAHIWKKIQVSNNSGASVSGAGFIPGAVVVKSPTGIDDDVEPSMLPTFFSLLQNYPNPFNPTTVIEFALPQASRVKLEVFNILGQMTMTLVDDYLPAGNHQVIFDATNFPSGIYFYRLSHKDSKLTRKMTLIK